MKRRDFLKGAALGSVALPSALAAKSGMTLKMATSWPARMPILQTTADYFADRVAQMTNGELKIKIYPANTLVPALGVFDAVSAGQIDLYHSGTYYWTGKNSAFSIFAGTPFGMVDNEIAAWMRFGGGLDLWRDVAAQYNLYPLLGGNTGMQMGGWFRKPVNSLKDLKGLKMRIPGLGAEILTKLGVNTVMMAGGEIYLALERNVIDASEWVSPALDLSVGFHKVAKYYYTSWHEPASTAEFVFNKKLWDSLPKDFKAVLEVASFDANARMSAEAQAKNAVALKELIKLGVEIKTFPKDVVEAAKVAMADVVKEHSAKNKDFVRVWKSYSSFLEEQKDWTKTGFLRYLEIR